MIVQKEGDDDDDGLQCVGHYIISLILESQGVISWRRLDHHLINFLSESLYAEQSEVTVVHHTDHVSARGADRYMVDALVKAAYIKEKLARGEVDETHDTILCQNTQYLNTGKISQN